MELAQVSEEERKTKFPSLEEIMPEIYAQLIKTETRWKPLQDMQDIRFTIQEGQALDAADPRPPAGPALRWCAPRHGNAQHRASSTKKTALKRARHAGSSRTNSSTRSLTAAIKRVPGHRQTACRHRRCSTARSCSCRRSRKWVAKRQRCHSGSPGNLAK